MLYIRAYVVYFISINQNCLVVVVGMMLQL